MGSRDNRNAGLWVFGWLAVITGIGAVVNGVGVDNSLNPGVGAAVAVGGILLVLWASGRFDED